MMGWEEPFDFNRDGTIDPVERSIELDILLPEDEGESEEWLDDELEAAGLDRDELALMDVDERRETLEDAGLDPDDFDFW